MDRVMILYKVCKLYGKPNYSLWVGKYSYSVRIICSVKMKPLSNANVNIKKKKKYFCCEPSLVYPFLQTCVACYSADQGTGYELHYKFLWDGSTSLMWRVPSGPVPPDLSSAALSGQGLGRQRTRSVKR